MHLEFVFIQLFLSLNSLLAFPQSSLEDDIFGFSDDYPSSDIEDIIFAEQLCSTVEGYR